MEEAALRDYKHKDIKNSRDFTAKLYNNENLPDVSEKYEPIQRGFSQPSAGEEPTTSKPADIGKRMFEAMAGKKKKVDPTQQDPPPQAEQHQAPPPPPAVVWKCSSARGREA